VSYRILQIVQGGKVPRLQDSTVIHWKTFTIVPHSQLQLLSEGNYFTGKVSQLLTNLWKPRNFSTSNNLQYTVIIFPWKCLEYAYVLGFRASSLLNTRTAISSYLWYSYIEGNEKVHWIVNLNLYYHEQYNFVLVFSFK